MQITNWKEMGVSVRSLIGLAELAGHGFKRTLQAGHVIHAVDQTVEQLLHTVDIRGSTSLVQASQLCLQPDDAATMPHKRRHDAVQ